MRRLQKIFFILILFFISCSNKEIALDKITFISFSDNAIYHFSDLHSTKVTVFVFLAPQCPMSESFAYSIPQVVEKYKDKGVKFYLVIPGNSYSDSEIALFQKTYFPGFEFLLDKNLDFAMYTHARVTPEVVVFNNKEEIIYSGALDNYAVDLETKRQVITEHYLEDALNNFFAGKKIHPEHTSAVGCFIQ